MPKLPRPFWQVLLIVLGDNQSEKLTCEECTAMMEYLADRAIEGATIEDLKSIANALFRFCTECKTHYQLHIMELERKVLLRGTS
jgi:hypothetical protein